MVIIRFLTILEFVIQINEKGHLRLSRRALLPDSEKTSPNQQDSNSTEESTTSGDVPAEQDPKNKAPSSRRKVSAAQADKNKEKASKRADSSARTGPYINKDKEKKSSSKAVPEVVSKDGAQMVNGEAKIG